MIYVVSGFMRSGTSAMMQALEAGGLPVIKRPERDRRIHLASDGKYRPNPHSLYEAQLEEMYDSEWPKMFDGHAVKVIGAKIIGMLAVHEYRVVVMERDEEEIRQSAEASFRVHVTKALIRLDLAEIYRQLNNRKDIKSIGVVQYGTLLRDPEIVLSMLNWPIDVKSAASVIDTKHHRFRKEKLVVGL